ncbi:hypothetical protein FE783_12620 [Paenibacillus mesophilus]|uniref:baseplate J/gp47 family protein n=1 Tax=Paenibacillus mesophilus TaxID=2582849 RepID=UPI00110E61B8|nr:baseplate J/gp47 family protein [Paenibacillus mesophilus]TMV49353.1 hypothetical protein FE783_12620 [Paenibacillus mesophilus]
MLDADGFKRPTHSELYAEMEIEAKAKYGETVNTSDRSLLGRILRLFAWFLSKAWQDTEASYYSAYKNTSDGVQLDRLAPQVGITRNLSTWAQGTLQVSGVAGYTVPAGFRVATEAGTIFETLAPIILNGSGSGSGTIQALDAGTGGNVAANTITVIIKPDANVTSVNNPAESSGGQDKETDLELRDKWTDSLAGGGAATIDAVRAALLRVTGVRAATVIENDKNTPDSDGRPPKSIEAYVLGGVAADIGQAILGSKAGGIEPYGSESVVVNDLAGNPHTMKFTYAAEILIHVRVTVTKNASYPTDGNTQMTNAIVRYIGGEATTGQLYVGLNMGDDVIYSRLIAAAYSVPGVEDVLIEVSTNGTTWTQANVAVDPQEVAQTAHTLITVMP